MKRMVVLSLALTLISTLLGAGCASQRILVVPEVTQTEQDQLLWQDEFNVFERMLVSTGRNQYFVLEPGFQIVLEGKQEKVSITVLDETVEIAGVITRVVEEREWRNGELMEVSRNFFAICAESKDVFYFGEEVDVYENGKVVKHTGEWQAGRDNANPGMIMAGRPTVGLRYYQEVAPGIAMDRAEVVSLNETVATPGGVFRGSLKTRETTPLNLAENEFKTYAPDVGLIQDAGLLLTSYGFIRP